MRKLFIIAVTLASGIVHGQSAMEATHPLSNAENKLNQSVERAQLENVSLPDALMELLAVANAAGGFVRTGDCCQTTFTIATHDMTLKQVLDTLVVLVPSYTWTVDHGAIYFYPRKAVPELLNTKIARFRPRTGPTYHLKNQLLETEEAKAAIRDLKLHATRFRGGLVSLKSKQVSVALDNATIGEILNAIVAAHGTATWQYGQRTDRQGLEYIITINPM